MLKGFETICLMGYAKQLATEGKFKEATQPQNT